ncbi:ATP-binding protein [candidate division KSB1 bacterium]|nr:ATP-binding protein [candidate division KSB1 bacterium]MBL7093610.1 ATP-binding protein [candidate division KSB1 bacterium]
MITRGLSKIILSKAAQMPVVAITGPRQSGKTTFAKALFPKYDYVNLEFPDTRAQAIDDPRLFLTTYKNGVVIDEIQRVPELFSYIQGIVDETGKAGNFILTGSQNFLLLEQISQTLAGRAALFHLLSFSITEIASAFPIADNFAKYAFTGTYPRIYDKQLQPTDWYPWYISSYIERDVRQIISVKDLYKFQTFLKICAGRVGQLFNASLIANEIGVNYKTIQSWISILEAGFIIFLLQPFHKNYNKRLTKSPKIYFYDTGLICSLLGIRSADELNFHYLKGEIFESLIFSEMKKHIVNTNNHSGLYFWQDNAGHEIDCIIETGSHVTALEIKSSTTMNSDFFKNLRYWQNLTGCSTDQLTLVYGGTENQQWSKGRVFGWKNANQVIKMNIVK